MRALSNDLTRPRYRITYILMSNKPKTVKVRYACGNGVGETEVALSKTTKYLLELITK